MISSVRLDSRYDPALSSEDLGGILYTDNSVTLSLKNSLANAMFARVVSENDGLPYASRVSG